MTSYVLTNSKGNCIDCISQYENAASIALDYLASFQSECVYVSVFEYDTFIKVGDVFYGRDYWRF